MKLACKNYVNWFTYLLYFTKYAFKRRRNKLRFLNNNIDVRLKPTIEFSYLNDDVVRFPYTSTKYLVEDQKLFNSCYQTLGWLYAKRFTSYIFKKKLLFFYGAFKYFSNNKSLIENSNQVFYGGINNFIEKIELQKFQEVEVELSKYQDGTLSKYRCKIKPSSGKTATRIKKALILDIGGAELFQHFVLEAYPILAFVKNFLINNPDIVLVLPKPRNIFLNRSELIASLDIKNLIYDFSRDNKSEIAISECYFLNFAPLNYNQNSSFLYKKLNSILYEKYRHKSGSEWVVYLTRGNAKMRKIANEPQIIELLDKYANKNGLRLKVVNSEQLDIQTIARYMVKAKVVFFMHGGQGLNSIFCAEGTKIIEVIATEETRTLGPLCTSIGFDHFVIPLNFNFYSESPINIPIEKLNKILHSDNSEFCVY